MMQASSYQSWLFVGTSQSVFCDIRTAARGKRESQHKIDVGQRIAEMRRNMPAVMALAALSSVPVAATAEEGQAYTSAEAGNNQSIEAKGENQQTGIDLGIIAAESIRAPRPKPSQSEIEKKEWELKFQKVKSENEANKELLNFAKQIALAQTMNQGKGGYKLAEWFR